jgi:predicted PurR-regulated permease PerM
MAEAAKPPKVDAPPVDASIAVTTGGEVSAAAPTTTAEQLENSRFGRRVLTVTLAIVGLVVIWLTKEMLLLIFAGVLVAVLLCGLTDVVTRHVPVSRGVALGAILFAFTAVGVLGVLFLGAELLEQFEQLSLGVSEAVAKAAAYVEQTPLGDFLRRPADGPQDPLATLAQLAGLVTTGVALVVAPLIVLAIGIYIAVDPYLYRQGLLYLARPERRDRIRDILQQTANVLWGWLMGRAFSMTLIGVTTGLGLWALGIPMALSLGVIAFVLNFIPYLGPPLSAAPAVLIAMTLGTNELIYVLLLYSAIQIVETYFLTPMVEHQAVSMPPAFTLSVQLLCGILLGFLGVLLATPLAATVVVLVRTLYIEDVLGDYPKLHKAAHAEADEEARQLEDARAEEPRDQRS